MRTSALSIVIVLLGCCPGAADGSRSDLVQELFTTGLMAPMNFDALLKLRASKFDRPFYNCLNDLRVKLAGVESLYDEGCERNHTTRDRVECRADNPVRRAASALSDIEIATHGRATWSQTTSGNGASLIQSRLTERLNEFEERTMPTLRQVFGGQIADKVREDFVEDETIALRQYSARLRMILTCPGPQDR